MKPEYKRIVVEQNELIQIQELINHIEPSESLMNSCITRLKQELSLAVVKPENEMPMNVIRINSTVDIETPFGIMKAQLVLPKNSNSAQKKISLLTPMGSALLGYAEGDALMWLFPNGEQKIRILKVSHSEFD